MAFLLQPECNFLHGFFRCKLPVEVVDMEVKTTSMQGTHIFKRQGNSVNQVHILEHKTLPAPHNYKENEDLSGGGE